ncbi:hypothetical protein CH296_26525 [Rhodococcus sp. 14-2496-1d]|uniref:N-acyl homoserine lactonase family protein n=1 Tax=Rhodococcus sp. 14-2496-1d TaxID=2023146 RepID=UPI000B9A7135|nr:N-acyl homoserine lactonase family protein [Rhodococcus sp. 14-2496-1d]OZF25674.1 hypothetical protein CH296_26525 [Rhodococcus sp. 14-2496-1d]
MTAAVYDAFALRYAALPEAESRKSTAYFHYGIYGEPDAHYPMDYYFWLVRNQDRTVLVDCGYDRERGRRRNRLQETDPVELLARMGTTPSEIDHVVLTHMHYDHVGNVGLFDNATFSMAATEFDYWTGPYADRPAIAWPVEAAEIALIEERREDGRLRLIVDDDEELFPGIRLSRMPGHTPGQLVTSVDTAAGVVVLGSDALHFYDEMILDRPFHTCSDFVQTFGTYERFRSLADKPGITLVAGHDPLVMTMFATVADQCVDLTVRTDGLAGTYGTRAVETGVVT